MPGKTCVKRPSVYEGGWREGTTAWAPEEGDIAVVGSAES